MGINVLIVSQSSPLKGINGSTWWKFNFCSQKSWLEKRTGTRDRGTSLPTAFQGQRQEDSFNLQRVWSM